MNLRASTKTTPKPKHWYRIHTTECALCGRGDQWRERMFTPKPTDPQERYRYTQYGCPEHFV